MCSISGYIHTGTDAPDSDSDSDSAIDSDSVEIRTARIAEVILAAAERGRDSSGIAGITPGGGVVDCYHPGAPSELIDRTDRLGAFTENGVTVAINNNRAEPTTEYVEEKDGVGDVQPFTGPNERYWVTHNGTIANDDEIAERYGFADDLPTDIDTAVIPHLLDAAWDDASIGSLRELLLSEVAGSFAFGIIDREYPDRLFLVTNYKPLSLRYDEALETVFFSSFDEYLYPGSGNSAELFDTSSKAFQLDPYQIAEIRAGDPPRIETRDFPADESATPEGAGASAAPTPSETAPDKDRALVVASGGLDSTVVAKQMLDEGYDTRLLHFTYRHRAESSELTAIRNIAERLDVELDVVDTDVFAEVIGGSKLTQTLSDAAKEEIAEGESGAEFAIEWVPARNFIMLSIAAGYAEAHGFDVIALGANLEEAGAYPDNEMEFIRRVDRTLPYATAADKDVRIEMPVGNLMKHEIVGRGLEIDAPLDLTWSCYEDGDLHCGDCGPCFMRKTAFDIHGADEVIEYETDPDTETDTNMEVQLTDD